MYLGQNTPEKYERAFSSDLLDGVFVLQSSNDRSHIDKAAAYGKPLVTINFLNGSGYPEVSMDYEEGMDLAVEHLLEKNVSRMLYMTWDEDNQPITRYRSRFQELSRKHSDRVTIEEYIAKEAYLDRNDIEEIAAIDTDGLIIDGYEEGIEVYKECLKQGRKIGDGFELVILADTPLTEEIDPSVLILQSQPEKVGQSAWKLMNDSLTGITDNKTELISFLKKQGDGDLINSEGVS
jgi:DNA-binding LacI/PurR family transcriptional regulator